MDSIGVVIAAILTMMVLSYILGDNLLFRLAAHIFVGVAVGYGVVLVLYSVLLPAVSELSSSTADPLNLTRVGLGLLLGLILLLFKFRPAQSNLSHALGNAVLALIVGVGAALAIGGGLFGTLLPQVSTTMSISLNPAHYQTDADTQAGLVEWLNNIIILLGTVGTFAYFTFAVRAPGPLGGLRETVIRFFAGMGRLIIIFTLGALFANTVSSRVALLIARLDFLINDFFAGLFSG